MRGVTLPGLERREGLFRLAARRFVSVPGSLFILIIFALLGTSGCIGMTGKPNNALAAAIDASPNSVNFGDVALGSNATEVVTITNGGVGNVVLASISATGTGFSISESKTPLTLTPGQSANLSAVFNATSAGLMTGTIAVTIGNQPSQTVANLTATGVASSFSANPPNASFGNVVVETNNSQPIMLSNSGTAPVTISAANVSGTAFSITGLSVPMTLAAGKKASFNAVFAPTSSGSMSGSVSLTSNELSAPYVIPFSGTGVAATLLLGANPTSLSFGNVNVNSSSSLPVTLTNNGNSNIMISGVTTTGAGFNTRGVTSGLTLQPGQTATLDVVFSPTVTGNVTGTAKVTSNASNSPATISLAGSGTPKNTQYSVGLSWAQSTSEVVGYFVYRGLKLSGPYTKLNSTSTPNTSYTDSSVTNSTTYFYYVTSVNSSNVESPPSSQVTVTIP